MFVSILGQSPGNLWVFFLLGSLEKVCCELYILKSRFPDGFRQMNLVMQGISFFLIAPLLATCPCACGSVDIAVEGDLPVELDEGTYGAWQSGRQQDAENSGVGCDFLSSSCSTKKGFCCALCWLFWRWVEHPPFSLPHPQVTNQWQSPSLSAPSAATCLVPWPCIGWVLSGHP